MKRTAFFLAAVLVVGSGSLLHANEANSRLTTSRAADQKNQYERSMEKRLAVVGKKLDELKAKSETLDDQEQREMGRYLTEAEKKQQVASDRLKAMRKKSVKQWKKFTAAMDKAMDEFEKAFEKAKNRFKE